MPKKTGDDLGRELENSQHKKTPKLSSRIKTQYRQNKHYEDHDSSAGTEDANTNLESYEAKKEEEKEEENQEDNSNYLSNENNLEQELVEIIESLEEIPGFEEELEKIVQELLSSNYLGAEQLIIQVLKRFLATGEGVNKSQMGKTLTRELEAIAGKSDENESLNISSELKKKLKSKRRRIKPTKHRSAPHEKASQELRRLKELLRKQFIYAAYKYNNPNRLAGETSKENFLNNIGKRGLNRAVEYAGGENKAKKILSETQPKKLTFGEKTSLSKIRSKNSHDKGIS